MPSVGSDPHQIFTIFPTAGHLAAYAGLAQVTRRSGSSIEVKPDPGAASAHSNPLFLSTFASLSDPTSCAY